MICHCENEEVRSFKKRTLLWFISEFSGGVPVGDVVAFKCPYGIHFIRNVNLKRGQILNNACRVA